MRASKVSLFCYVGVNMRTSVEALAREHELRTGVHIDVETNDPRPLIDKIVVSPTADLFVCHDPFLPMLISHGIKVSEAWTVATLVPTIAVRKGNPKKIHGLEDLARPGVRVGLTDATSMSGNIVALMVKKAGIEPQFRANVVKEFPAGRALAGSLIADEIDAGIIWNAVIHIFGDQLDPVAIDERWRPTHGPESVSYSPALGRIELDYVRVTIALLCGTRYPTEARAFAEFVASPEGAAVFRKNGFSPADPNRPALWSAESDHAIAPKTPAR